MQMGLVNSIRLIVRKRQFREGVTLSRFIAPDVRREIEILGASEIDKGYVNARIRTWNVLYASKGISPVPAFGEPQRIDVTNLWAWNGPRWGGPVTIEGNKHA